MDSDLKFQTMTFVRSKNISLRYQRFTTLGSKDIGLENQSLWQRVNSFLLIDATDSSKISIATKHDEKEWKKDEQKKFGRKNYEIKYKGRKKAVKKKWIKDENEKY